MHPRTHFSHGQVRTLVGEGAVCIDESFVHEGCSLVALATPVGVVSPAGHVLLVVPIDHFVTGRCALDAAMVYLRGLEQLA